MDNPFTADDIGKLVLLYIDPKKDSIAKALGASRVEATGRILEITDDYVNLQLSRNTFPLGGRMISTNNYYFDKLLDYRFL